LEGEDEVEAGMIGPITRRLAQNLIRTQTPVIGAKRGHNVAVAAGSQPQHLIVVHDKTAVSAVEVALRRTNLTDLLVEVASTSQM